MHTKLVGLRLIANCSGYEKQAQWAQAAALGAKALPWLARAGPAIYKLRPQAATLGRGAWNAFLLDAGLRSGISALGEGAHGLHQLSQGEGREGLKSLGRGGLNVLYTGMAASPVSKLLRGAGRLSIAARATKSKLPVMVSKYMPAPGMRSKGNMFTNNFITNWLQGVPRATASRLSQPPALADTYLHGLATKAVSSPTVGPALAGMMGTGKATKLITIGNKLDRFGNVAAVPGLVGVGIEPLLSERMPQTSNMEADDQQYNPNMFTDLNYLLQ